MDSYYCREGKNAIGHDQKGLGEGGSSLVASRDGCEGRGLGAGLLRGRQVFDDAQIRQFFLDNTSVDPAEFDKVYNSKEIEIKIKQAESLQQKAKITGVPSIIVNGKYLTSASKARSNDNLLKVIDYLVDKEREG